MSDDFGYGSIITSWIVYDFVPESNWLPVISGKVLLENLDASIMISFWCVSNFDHWYEFVLILFHRIKGDQDQPCTSLGLTWKY